MDKYCLIFHCYLWFVVSNKYENVNNVFFSYYYSCNLIYVFLSFANSCHENFV